METTHNSVKVKLGIKGMKLVESLIGREVTVGQGSECHLTMDPTKVSWPVLGSRDKKEEIWLSPMTKAPSPTEMSKGQNENTHNATKS